MTDIDSSDPDPSAMSGSSTDSSDIMATTNETELPTDEDVECFFFCNGKYSENIRVKNLYSALLWLYIWCACL